MRWIKLSDGSLWNIDRLATVTEPNEEGRVYVGFGDGTDDTSLAGPRGQELYDAVVKAEIADALEGEK